MSAYFGSDVMQDWERDLGEWLVRLYREMGIREDGPESMNMDQDFDTAVASFFARSTVRELCVVAVGIGSMLMERRELMEGLLRDVDVLQRASAYVVSSTLGASTLDEAACSPKHAEVLAECEGDMQTTIYLLIAEALVDLDEDYTSTGREWCPDEVAFVMAMTSVEAS